MIIIYKVCGRISLDIDIVIEYMWLFFSPFWQGVLQEKKFNWHIGINKILGNGESILFWFDRWTSESSLKILFPDLFEIAVKSNILVAQIFSEGIYNIQFRRQLTGYLVDKFYSLMDHIAQFNPSISIDTIVWRWDVNGVFSVQSYYNWLDYGGIKKWWISVYMECKYPFKHKIFSLVSPKKENINKG